MDLKPFVDILNADGVVAIPTETVYGLAAKISSPKALELVFKIKQRPFFDPLIVHVTDRSMALPLTLNWSPVCDQLVKTYWPGPLTLILKKNADRVCDLITSGFDTVAVRAPQHPLTLKLIDEVGPLAAPSANRFGKTSPSTAEHVRAEFDVPICDGGACQIGIESTVVEVNDDILRILRPGAITYEDLNKNYRVEIATSAQSPGHLEHHYQPQKPLILVDHKDQLFKHGYAIDQGVELVLDSQPAIAARTLYSQLRLLSQTQSKFIFLVTNSLMNGGLWTAVNDRLKKAATLNATTN